MSERAKEIKDAMAKHELEPDLEFIKEFVQYLRDYKSVTLGDTLRFKQADCEFSLLNYVTQSELIDVFERNIISQDKFSKNANFLAWAAIFLALVEIAISLASLLKP